MSEFDDIDGETGEGPATESGGTGPAVSAAAVGACLSCGAPSVGVFCANCGQKNDDLRRSIFLLGRDFLEDTFAFDSRMWRTLGVLAVMPGLVPTNFSHGKRSRYTPPVRLFLVVSFLFFLALALTRTVFVAIEVTPKTEEQIAREAAAIADVKSRLEEENVELDVESAKLDFGEGRAVDVDGAALECDLNFATRFFVKASEVTIDQDAWRKCADSIRASANIDVAGEDGRRDEVKTAETQALFERVMSGFSTVIEDPVAFTAAINTWLPRVMFFMTPLAALMMGLFIRGRDALFFDHMVMSLYSHAVAFTLAGAAIILTQIGVPYAGMAALAALFAYSVMSVKRAYGRGWVKTVYSTVMIGFLYLIALVSIVTFIVVRLVVTG